MGNRKNSFASRMSRKVVLITSLIYLITIGVISFRGARITKRDAINFSAQMLQTSIFRLESSIKGVETVVNDIAGAVEAVRSVSARFDTASYYTFLEETVADCPYVLGTGVFYQPYRYDNRQERVGIYIEREQETGRVVKEWIDNTSLRIDGYDYFDMDWFKTAKAIKEGVWISPFRERTVFSDTVFVSSYVKPVLDRSGGILAICGVDISLEWLHNELMDMRPYKASGVILVDSEGNFICNPISDTPYEGNILDIDVLEGNDLAGSNDEDLFWTARKDGVLTTSFKVSGTHLFCVKGKLYNGWELIVVNRYRDAFSDLISIWVIIGIIAALGLIILFFVSFGIIRSETSALKAFANAAGRITDGHFDVPIPKVPNEDEIAELGAALTYMQKSVTDYIEELKVTTSEKERLAGELDIARKIQMQMLNRGFLSIKGCGMFASSVPARQVGGDLYDFYAKGDTIFYIIADVSGKGVPAALLMSISISAFRAAIRNKHTMSEIIDIINNVFCRSNDDNMFITVNVGSINVKTGETEFCNAGHNPIVLISPEGEASFLTLHPNLVCGVMSDFQYQSDHMVLEKGSRLIIYTDGVTEAENSKHEQYGEDRLLAFAATHGKNMEPMDEKVVEDLSKDVAGFVGETEQFDDITMMSITI